MQPNGKVLIFPATRPRPEPPRVLVPKAPVYRCAGGCDAVVGGEDCWCLACTALHPGVNHTGAA